MIDYENLVRELRDADAPVRVSFEHPWGYGYRLISWWDMEQFSARVFYKIGKLIERLKLGYQLARAPGDQAVSGAEFRLSPESIVSLTDFVKQVRDKCADIGLNGTVMQCDFILRNTDGLTNKIAAHELFTLEEFVQLEMNDHLFMRIPTDRKKYYEQSELFGADAAAKFPKATQDIREVGNCLATGRSTAAAYHAMCVLEVGLDSLAFALSLPYSQKDWNQVLNAIESKVAAIDPSHGPDWKADKEWYGKAALEFRFFKDAWRNHTMHGRARYDWKEAENIMEHVKAFMVHLSTRLQERP